MSSWFSSQDWHRSSKRRVEELTLEHVDHVLEVNEGVVDGNNVGVVVDDRVTEDDTSDSAEAARFDREATRCMKGVSIAFLCIKLLSG